MSLLRKPVSNPEENIVNVYTSDIVQALNEVYEQGLRRLMRRWKRRELIYQKIQERLQKRRGQK